MIGSRLEALIKVAVEGWTQMDPTHIYLLQYPQPNRFVFDVDLDIILLLL